MNWPNALLGPLLLASLACNPDKAAATTDAGSTTELTSSTSTGDFASLCEDLGDVLAGFSINLGDWPVAGDEIVLDVECQVAGPTEFTCPDEQGVSRSIGLNWTAEPAVPTAWSSGDTVEFRLRRGAQDPDDRGAFTVRTREGQLLLGGNSDNASHPGDPEFFAPLRFSIDDFACPYEEVGSCLSLRPFILAVEDGADLEYVSRGRRVDLPSGHWVQVERAAITESYYDPKFCPVSDPPPVYRLLLGLASSDP